MGRFSSIIAFQRAKAIDWHNGLILAIPYLFGTILGAYIATILQAKFVGWAITFAVIAAFVVLLTNPKRLLKDQQVDKPVIRWWHALGIWECLSVFLGIYSLAKIIFLRISVRLSHSFLSF